MLTMLFMPCYDHVLQCYYNMLKYIILTQKFILCFTMLSNCNHFCLFT